MDAWSRGSADSTQALIAVRAAVREMDRRRDQSDDHQILFLREELAAIRDLAYRVGPGDAAQDALEAIHFRASRALNTEATR